MLGRKDENGRIDQGGGGTDLPRHPALANIDNKKSVCPPAPIKIQYAALGPGQIDPDVFS